MATEFFLSKITKAFYYNDDFRLAENGRNFYSETLLQVGGVKLVLVQLF